jgi:hypothetical protein
MNWAEVGKKAVFFHNGGASETCIGTYWYQCYNEGEWWGMSHAEPFLLRTYYGQPEKLAEAVTQILQGKEVVVTCLADGNKEQLHQRKGKVQRLKASLKLLDYNQKRDFVGWGGDGEEVEEFKSFTLLPESSAGWRFIPLAEARDPEARWRGPDFDDKAWREGKTPIGYGEQELHDRQGTIIAEREQDFLFRRAVNIPVDLLNQKGVTFRIAVASDDSAVIYLNGEVIDEDPEPDHEFAYWNREIELQPKQLRPGRNVIAAHVKNRAGSSDLYFDLEVTAQYPLPKPAKKVQPMKEVARGPLKMIPSAEPPGPKSQLSVDREARSITVPCKIAPRKLSSLEEIYPLEVIATYPSPAGQKAHETVVVFTGIRPSDVHRALEELGLKPGKPAKGDARAEGPELTIALEIGSGAQAKRLPIEELLVSKNGGQKVPPMTWHFTGSALRQPDPEKDEAVYGADASGTLITIFPVSEETVIQGSLTMKDESVLKLERLTRGVPREGSPAKLIITAK